MYHGNCTFSLPQKHNTRLCKCAQTYCRRRGQYTIETCAIESSYVTQFIRSKVNFQFNSNCLRQLREACSRYHKSGSGCLTVCPHCIAVVRGPTCLKALAGKTFTGPLLNTHTMENFPCVYRLSSLGRNRKKGAHFTTAHPVNCTTTNQSACIFLHENA